MPKRIFLKIRVLQTTRRIGGEAEESIRKYVNENYGLL
jgi:hypothetical protein